MGTVNPMIYLTITLLLLIILFVGFDLYVYIDTRFARFKIGKYADDKQWQKAILNKSKKWLKKTPVIKVTDNNRLILLDMLRGNYKRRAIQSWQQAAVFMGIYEAYKQGNTRELKQMMDGFVATLITSQGNLKKQLGEIEDVMPMYALIEYLPQDEKYKQAFDETYSFVLSLMDKQSDTIPYRRHVSFYRFVDTLGFVCPFLMSYGVRYNVPDAIQLAYRQIEAFNQYGMYADTLIPAHAYREDNKLAVGLFGWGRGMGWYAIGLIDSWAALPEYHELKPLLTEQVKRYALLLIETQRDNGTWGWYILEKNAQSDSSAVATLCWFLTQAAAIPEIEVKARNTINKGLAYLKTVTRRDGAIDFNQGDTKSIGIYSTHFNILPFTQGFALRTLSAPLFTH